MRLIAVLAGTCALAPHLTARDNVAFALRRRRVSRLECRTRACMRACGRASMRVRVVRVLSRIANPVRIISAEDPAYAEIPGSWGCPEFPLKSNLPH